MRSIEGATRVDSWVRDRECDQQNRRTCVRFSPGRDILFSYKVRNSKTPYYHLRFCLLTALPADSNVFKPLKFRCTEVLEKSSGAIPDILFLEFKILLSIIIMYALVFSTVLLCFDTDTHSFINMQKQKKRTNQSEN